MRTKIKTKIIAGYLSFVLLILSLLGISYGLMKTTVGHAQEMYDRAEQVRVVMETENIFRLQVSAMTRYLFFTDEKNLEEFRTQRARFLEQLEIIKPFVETTSTEDKKGFEQLVSQYEVFTSNFQKAAQFSQSGNRAEAIRIKIEQIDPAEQEIERILKKFIDYKKSEAEESVDSFKSLKKYEGVFPFLSTTIENAEKIHIGSHSLQLELAIQSVILKQGIARTELFLFDDTEYIGKFYELEKQIQEISAEKKKIVRRDEEKPLIAGIAEKHALLVAGFGKMAKLYEAGDKAAALKVLTEELAPIQENLTKQGQQFYRLHQENRKRSLENVRLADAAGLAVINNFSVYVVILLLFGLFIGTVIALRISRPISRLAEVTKRLGAGDFSVRAKTESRDEIGDLAASFNRMAESLQTTTVSKNDLEAIVKERTVDLARANEAMRRAHDELEVKVTKRTAELAQVNEELKTDIIERERADANLQESELRYRLLFDRSPNPIMVCDAETLEFLAVNEEAVRHYGYSREEFQIMTGRELHLPEELDKLRENLAQAEYGVERFQGIRHRKKNGELIEIEAAVQQINFDGRRAWLSLITDVTEQNRIETERQVTSEIIQGIAVTSNLDQLLAHINQSLKKVLYAENCFVALHDSATDMMSFEYWVDKFDPPPAPRPPGTSFSSHILRTGEPLLLTDELENEMYASGAAERGGTKAASWIGVPLITRSRTIGVLVLQHYEKENVFSRRDLEFLVSVGYQIAISIERKRAEEALALESSLMKALMDNIPDGIYFKDTQSRFLRVSKHIHLRGISSPEEAVGKTDFDFFTDEHARAAFEDERRIIETGEPVMDLEEKETFHDGTECWVLTTKVPIFDSDGEITGIIGASRDITERKRTEALIRESEDKYRNILASIEEGYFEIDLGGNFTFFNDALSSLIGYTGDETTGMNYRKYVDRKNKRILVAEMTQILKTGEPAGHVAWEITRKDNSRKFVESSLALMRGEGGKPIGFRGLVRDVTERKRAEQELRESQQFLKIVLDTLPQAVWWKDKELKYIGCNRSLAEIAGLESPEQLIGLTDYDMPWKKEEADFYRECDRRVIESGVAELNIIEPIFQADGKKAWLNTNKAPFRNANGEIVGVLGTFIDITEQRRAEQAVQNSRDYLDSIINAVGDPIFVKNRKHQLTLVNDAMCRFIGRAREECLGKTSHELFASEEADIFWAKDELVFTAGEENINEEKFTDPNGNTCVIITRKRLHIDKDGEQFIVGVSRDITEDKQIKKILVDSEIMQRQLAERQSAILDALPAHICLLDSSGKILEVNDEWKQFAIGNGYSGFDFGAGSNYLETCENATGDCSEGAKHAADICRAVLAGDSSDFEMEYPCHSPTEKRWFQLSVTPFHKEELIGAVVMHINITERKQIEEELERTRDAALESARMKSEFLANMSHEIRTPMNGVIGMTGLLLDSNLNDEQNDYAQTIQTSADALLRIIDDILDFSKIEAGRMSFEKIDFDLNDCVESPIELLAEKAQSKGIEIASLIYADVPRQLCGDPGRLRQVMTNLIGNAVKFTEKGEVTVSVKKLCEADKYVSLRFEITDSGIGISEKQQRLLFRAFTQADGSTTRKYGGTGLGLAISKQLVELMDGEIGIESEAGKGSTFWFTARFEKQSNQTPMIQSDNEADIEGVRVLIVDDNETNRKIFLHQTTSWGMIAAEAESGVAALEMLRTAADKKEPFEIAILDLMMPGMDGFQLAGAIKSDPLLARTHLILLPSYGKRGDGQTARDSGIAAYIQKPVRQSQLYNCLTTVIAEAAGKNNDGEKSLRLITQHSLRGTNVPKAVMKTTVSKVRILVAEDNTVNQKVALSQLKNLGYTADVVENGREAVDAAAKNFYDIILMDCQMPEMDGFEATDEIRRRESASRRTTIIAMTAHALEGEREKCLAAGMDDYISKPVKLEMLTQTLNRWIVPANAAAPYEIEPLEANHDADDCRNYQSIDLSVLDGFKDLQPPNEPDLVTELINLFLEDTGEHIKAVETNFAVRKTDEIRQQAHAVKGSSGNIGALRLAKLSEKLEAENLDHAQTETLIRRITDEFEKVSRILNDMRQSETPPVTDKR